MSKLGISILALLISAFIFDFKMQYNVVLFYNLTEKPVYVAFKYKAIKTTRKGELVSRKQLYKDTQLVQPYEIVQFSTLESKFYFVCFGNTENTKLIYQPQDLAVEIEVDEDIEALMTYDGYQIKEPFKKIKIEIKPK